MVYYFLLYPSYHLLVIVLFFVIQQFRQQLKRNISMVKIDSKKDLLRNLPPGPLGRRMACLCLLSWRYGFLVLSNLCNSSSFKRAARLLRIRWYCFAFTYNGSSSTGAAAATTTWYFNLKSFFSLIMSYLVIVVPSYQ